MDIIRTSLDEGILPDILKKAWITPIWKGGPKEDPKEYRPISLTSHVGKLAERVVRKQVQSYLETNKLIENDQHGSREGRGTLSQLIEQHDELANLLMEGKEVNLIYLDFSKAFDLVDHSILLRKLQRKGVKGKLLNWILEFLKSRKQQVRIGNKLSPLTNLRSGVP